MAASKRTVISCLILAAFAATVCCACLFVVWLGDDVDYGYFINTSIWDSSGEIDSLKKFFFSQGNHYWYVNGRAVAHTLVQLFCAILGQEAFAACNVLVYCAFIWLILRTAVRRPLQHPSAVAFVGAMVLLVFVTKMMPTTQIGFVWMFTLNLLWLRLFFSRRCLNGWCKVAGVTLLSLLAGNGQEALTLGLAGAMVLWWLGRKGRVPVARTIWLIAYGIGVLADVLSPGTLGRAAAADVPLSDSILYLLLSLRATYVAIVIIVWQVAKDRKTLSVIWRGNRLWITAWMLLLAFNLVVGVYANRQLFGLELCALVLCVRLLHGRFSATWALVFCLLAALHAWAQLDAARSVRRQYRHIDKLVNTVHGGTIYYDRTQASQNLYLREYRWYEEIVGQYNNDTHHSLQKHLHYKYPEYKYATVWPVFVGDGTHRTDTTFTYAPDHRMAVLLKHVAADSFMVVVHRHRVLPIRTELTPDTIRHFPRPTVRGGNWQAAILLNDVPFARIDTAYVLPFDAGSK